MLVFFEIEVDQQVLEELRKTLRIAYVKTVYKSRSKRKIRRIKQRVI